MQEAELIGVDFSHARMEQAQLTDSKCDGAIFASAHLDYADFSNSSLKNCDFSLASLYRTNLHDVDSSDVIWSGSGKAQALETDQKRYRAQHWAPK